MFGEPLVQATRTACRRGSAQSISTAAKSGDAPAGTWYPRSATARRRCAGP
jgi:hypothetical protein